MWIWLRDDRRFDDEDDEDDEDVDADDADASTTRRPDSPSGGTGSPSTSWTVPPPGRVDFDKLIH